MASRPGLGSPPTAANGPDTAVTTPFSAARMGRGVGFETPNGTVPVIGTRHDTTVGVATGSAISSR